MYRRDFLKNGAILASVPFVGAFADSHSFDSLESRDSRESSRHFSYVIIDKNHAQNAGKIRVEKAIILDSNVDFGAVRKAFQSRENIAFLGSEASLVILSAMARENNLRIALNEAQNGARFAIFVAKGA